MRKLIVLLLAAGVIAVGACSTSAPARRHPAAVMRKTERIARRQQDRMLRRMVGQMCASTSRHPAGGGPRLSQAQLRQICRSWHVPMATQRHARLTALMQGCPVTGAGPYVSCVRQPDSSTGNVGLQITDGAGSNPGLLLLGTDFNGAPMLSDGLTGLMSYGDGGREIGGNICVTYGVASYTACLTPTGTLQLTPTGPHGATGPTVTLTPADIRFLHRLERR